MTHDCDPRNEDAEVLPAEALEAHRRGVLEDEGDDLLSEAEQGDADGAEVELVDLRNEDVEVASEAEANC